jgi:hypothetical protein
VLGAGIICAATVLVWGDTWRYVTLAALVATLLVAIGVALNAKYIRGFSLAPRGERAGASNGQPPARARGVVTEPADH